MKKIIVFTIVLCLFLSTLFVLTSCGNDDFELSETAIEVAIDNFEGFTFNTNSKFEIESSNESIAVVSSSRRYTEYSSNLIIVTVKGISAGECVISVKVGNTVKSVNVKVGFIPEITLQHTGSYSFHIETNFPTGTILFLTLNGADSSSSQKITLEKKSWYYSYQNFSFENINNGSYSLIIQLDSFDNQPQETKRALGTNGEYVLGEYVDEANNSFKVIYTFDLPYKSIVEQIVETEYSKLTYAQRKYIKQWIDARYDYYDNKEGKYTGNKYTETIMNEAANRFNKTYSQIKTIWGDPTIPLS